MARLGTSLRGEPGRPAEVMSLIISEVRPIILKYREVPWRQRAV